MLMQAKWWMTALLLIFSPTLFATVTYSYVGNDYGPVTVIGNGDGAFVTNAKNFNATLTFDASLPDGVILLKDTNVQYVVSDGQNTFTNANAFNFSDASFLAVNSGKITEWVLVFVDSINEPSYTISAINYAPSGFIEASFYGTSIDLAGRLYTGNPSTWTISSPVPETHTSHMLFAGLAMMLAVARRHK